MLSLLIFLTMAAQTQVTLEGADAIQVQSEQLKHHRDEAYLISKRIDPGLLRNLLVWTSTTRQWQAPKTDAVPGAGARVRVIHLWADYCAPCGREFPWLRALFHRANAAYKGRVRYLFVAENTASESMAAYLAAHHGKMPEEAHYQDTQSQLMEVLRAGLPSGNLSLPATLVVDEQGIIRQAIVGPLTEPVERRPELISAIERLLALP